MAMAIPESQLALFPLSAVASSTPAKFRKYTKAEFNPDLCRRLILDHLADGNLHRLHERDNPTLRAALAGTERQNIAFSVCDQLVFEGLIECVRVDDGSKTHLWYKLRAGVVTTTSLTSSDAEPAMPASKSSDLNPESFPEKLKAKALAFIASANGDWVSLFGNKEGSLASLTSTSRTVAIKSCQELEAEGLIESRIRCRTQTVYRLVCDSYPDTTRKDCDPCPDSAPEDDELVLTKQEFYQCIQSTRPGKSGQPHYSDWRSLERTLRQCLAKLRDAQLFDNRHKAISRGLASGDPGEWSWSDIEISFKCLTTALIPGQRIVVKNRPVLVKPRSGSGSSSTPASPPYSNPVKAEVVPVDSVAIVTAPPPVPLAATDEAMDLSGLTPEELLYNEVKRNYVLRKFDQRSARRILDQVCQSVGRVLPWLEIDGEYYIPTDSVAELYGVEQNSVIVAYNRRPTLFSPITRKFEGQDLVNLRSHLNSLRVGDLKSPTLREFEKAVNMTRNLIGYTALAVLQMSNISETSMARTINMAIITALSEIFPGMERAAAMGKSQLGQTITNADIAELACQQQQIIRQNHAMMAELEYIKSGVNDIRSCLGSSLYDNLQKLLGEMVSNFFQAEQWLMSAKKIEDLIAAHADLNPTVRGLLFDVQSMMKAKRAYVTELVENDHIQFLWEHDLYKGKCPVSYEQIVGEVDGEVVALKDSTGKKLGQPDHNFQVNKASHAMTWFVSASVNQRLNHDEAYRDEIQTRFKVYQEDLRKWLAARNDTGQQRLELA